MNVAFYIARRYLFSSRSKNAVNIITSISVFGVSIGSLALVVVLSVFNGFESIIKSQFNPISSDFIVSPINSKEFSSKDIDFNALKEISSWESIKEVYEEKVLLRFDEYEQISYNNEFRSEIIILSLSYQQINIHIHINFYAIHPTMMHMLIGTTIKKKHICILNVIDASGMHAHIAK